MLLNSCKCNHDSKNNQFNKYRIYRLNLQGALLFFSLVLYKLFFNEKKKKGKENRKSLIGVCKRRERIIDNKYKKVC